MFCKHCGSIMLPKQKNGSKVAECNKCGYSEKSELKVRISEKIRPGNVKVDVVEEMKETLPKTEAECPKCRNAIAYYWTQQTRAADEGETKFLKCEKCSHIWRDYG